tara:strand:+ start:474 stop:713 length:240 start_codon:yes stop_codon:yes gene_type:complete
MTRKSKAVFKMKGYSYPGISPMTKKIKKENNIVDEVTDEKEREEEEYEVPTPDNKLAANIEAGIRNVGARKRMKERQQK